MKNLHVNDKNYYEILQASIQLTIEKKFASEILRIDKVR